MERFLRNIKPAQDHICILAGDIGNPYHANYDQFMQHINRSFQKTFVIPGNHEYYNNKIKYTNQYLTDYFKKWENISFLNNQYEIYAGHCFIGTTLWSKITDPSNSINDVYAIKEFDYLQYNRLHMLAVDFLEDAVEKNENCIVITHHLPSEDLIDPKYKTSKMRPYNQWFYANMDQFIEKNVHKIKGWFYGHTHTPAFTMIRDIPFCCNAIGYPNENPRIDFEKTLVLGE